MPEPDGPMTTTTSPLLHLGTDTPSSALMADVPVKMLFQVLYLNQNGSVVTAAQPPFQFAYQPCVKNMTMQQIHEPLRSSSGISLNDRYAPRMISPPLGQIVDGHIAGDRGFLQQHDKLVRQGGQHVFQRLRNDDIPAWSAQS